MFSFEKLLVYQKALEYANDVYEETKNWPNQHSYTIIDQLRRASLSIALNIAEGSGRTGSEFQRFISISRSSAYECVPIIELAYKQKLLSQQRKEEWLQTITSIAKMLSKLKSSLTK